MPKDTSNNSPMRVAIALLVDDDLCNRACKSTMRFREYGFGLRVLRLPPHVSLKQPFIVSEFDRFETYFDGLARRIEAQKIVLDGFQFFDAGKEGIVSLRVTDDGRLLELHTQLNSELEREFGGTQAEYDGDGYEFHLTVAIGAYQTDFHEKLQAEIANMSFREQAVSTKLAMFIYEELDRSDALYGIREYGTYKVLPLQA